MPVQFQEPEPSAKKKGRKGASKSAKKLPRQRRSRSTTPSRRSKSKKRGARSLSASVNRKPLDMMSAAAMQNLQYIAHDATHALTLRGFRWQERPTKKGSKGKKGKRKR